MSRRDTRPSQTGVPDSAPAPAPAPARRAWVEQIMGMPISIHLRGDDVDGSAASEAVASAFRILREMDSIFSTYRDDSDLMRLRREEAPGLAVQSPRGGGAPHRAGGGGPDPGCVHDPAPHR